MPEKKTLLGISLALALAGTLAAQQPWIHVEVQENGEDASTVRVNLPVTLAEVALSMAPKKVLEKATHALDEHELSLADLRNLWTTLKDSGDAEFVSVEGADESVKVAREGDLIRVRVTDSKKDKPSTVHVDLPIDVVDALLSGDGQEINLPAAIAQLKQRRGDIIRVDDGESNVRVWIDEKS